MDNTEELAAMALLVDPVRWRLYDYLRSSRGAVGRDEAARAANISRNLASFHLDRMAEANLLEVEYRRLSGRTGRGAGRLLRRCTGRVEVGHAGDVVEGPVAQVGEGHVGAVPELGE